MRTPGMRCVLLGVAVVLPACDNRPAPTATAHLTVPAATTTAAAIVTTTTASSTNTQTLGHVRVSIQKVSVGKVPLKAADGTITYADEPRLMIALRIENTSDAKRSEYNTWVPDLDAAKT